MGGGNACAAVSHQIRNAAEILLQFQKKFKVLFFRDGRTLPPNSTDDKKIK